MTIRNKAALLGAELSHSRGISLRRAIITDTDEVSGTVRVKFGGANGTELDYDLPVVGNLPEVDDSAYVIVAGKKLICLSVS